MSKKVHCMSLGSIRIFYNYTPRERLKPNPEPWYGFTYFQCPAEVEYIARVRKSKNFFHTKYSENKYIIDTRTD